MQIRNRAVNNAISAPHVHGASLSRFSPHRLYRGADYEDECVEMELKGKSRDLFEENIHVFIRRD
jgi:hypothetical protein